MTVVRPLVFAVLVLPAWPSLQAAEPSGKDAPEPDVVSYYRDVRPIFVQHCQGCHQPAKAQGGLIMTDHPDLLKPGDSGEPAVLPGKPEKSLILTQITSQGGKPPAMPKGKNPLIGRDVLLIKK